MYDALLETAASQFVESYGALAHAVLEQRAEIAEQNGLRVAAKTWRDMASVVRRLLQDHQMGARLQRLN